MEQNPNIIAIKRDKFKVELRRQQLDDLFQKRRQELQHWADHQPPLHPNNPQQIQQLQLLLQTLQHQSLYPIIEQVIQMDQSLSLLFHVTAMVPENVPAFFSQIITHLCRDKVPQKIELMKIKQDIEYASFPKETLTRIGELYDNWRKTEGQTYCKIKSLLNQLQDLSQAATNQLIQFVTLIANISLIVVWAEQTLLREQGGMEQNQPKRKHQLTSSISILINMLAGKQQNIVQFIPLILYSSCNNIRCISIYFNLFLIKTVDPTVKFEMFRVFVRILCLNHQEVLEQHRQIIAILANCMTTMPQLPPTLQPQYLQIALKAKDMLSSLLSILNLRYENTQLYLAPASISTDEEDKLFIHHIAVILQKLSQEKYLCCSILQSKPIVSFMLAHLQPSEHNRDQRTACCLMTVLNRSTFNSFSFEVFSKQILFIHKMLKIITKLDRQANQSIFGDRLMLSYLYPLLGTLTNCCQCMQFYSFFLQQNLLSTVVSLYFKLTKGRGKQVREQCLYLYLNMLICAQQYLFDSQEQRSLVVNLLLGSSKNNNLFIQVLKSTQTQLLDMAIQAIGLLVRVQQKCSHSQVLNAFLSNYCLHQQINCMTQSDNERVEQYGLKARMLLSQRVHEINDIDEQAEYL